MKLYFDKRPFSWEDQYSIYDETDQRAYMVVAEEGKKENTISLQNRNGVEMGRVRCRKTLFGKWKFSIWYDESRLAP